MSAYIRETVERLIRQFEEAWAESAAWRAISSGSSAEPEVILQAYRRRAEELFQPALSEIRGNARTVDILAGLLDQLERESSTHV